MDDQANQQRTSPGSPMRDVYLGSQRGTVNGIQKTSPTFQHTNVTNNYSASPLESLDRNKFDEEKMLIEQDPFLLEEQRYLSRIQKANYKQELAYKKHEATIVQPNLQKKLN
jgi:hypothetical protein